MSIDRPADTDPPERPRLSVIISSYRAGVLLEECLLSLERQKGADAFEIIVVDSSEEEVDPRLKERFPSVRFVLFRQRKYCGDARNAGLEAARADIIAFLDADCRAESDWVWQILRAHESPVLAVGGAIACGNPESLVGWAAYFCEFSDWMPGYPPRLLRDMAGANMSYKRGAFGKFGPLIEGTYCSDTEFHWRLAAAGHRILFEPGIRVSHHNITRLDSFLGHELEHGRAFGRVRVAFSKFSAAARVLALLLSPALPAWLFLRIAARNARNRAYFLPFLKSCPLVLLGVVSWSLGECMAYAGSRVRNRMAGPGDRALGTGEKG